MLLKGLIVSTYFLFYALGYHSLDALAFFDALSDLGTADVEQWGFNDSDPCRHFAHAASLTGIDNDGVVGKDIFVMIPLVESSPVVTTYQQRKLDVCVILADGL